MEAWLSPMLCTAVDAVPEGRDWMIEGKLDGWRTICHNNGSGVRMFNGRNGSEYSGKLPYIERALAELLPADTAVDGELIGGEWGDVQGVMTRGAGAHVPSVHVPALTYVIFDVIRLVGHDVRSYEWLDRRSFIEQIAFDVEHLSLSPAVPATRDAHDALLKLGLEGSVCKHKQSRYVNGRSALWVKIKPTQTTEAQIIGFKPGSTGTRWAGKVGAFKVRLLDTGAETTVKCGTDCRHEEATAHPDRWLDAVIEVQHHGWQTSGKVRHPTFLRRRDDRTVMPAPTRKVTMTPSNPSGATGRMRNYGAMGAAKLVKCLRELRAGSGDAYERALTGSGNPDADLQIVEGLAREKGLA